MRRRLLKISLLIALLSSSPLTFGDSEGNESTVGMEIGLGVNRGTSSFDLSRAVLGFPKDNMYGGFGSTISAFFQSSALYLSVAQWSSQGLFDKPQTEGTGIHGLVGISLPDFSRRNWWSVTLASGVGVSWGNARGSLIEKGLLGNTYTESRYWAPSLPIELKASLRFLEHAGLGLKYAVELNNKYSSNTIALFLEGFL